MVGQIFLEPEGKKVYMHPRREFGLSLCVSSSGIYTDQGGLLKKNN